LGVGSWELGARRREKGKEKKGEKLTKVDILYLFIIF
jgi:hypothetical protein